MRAEEKSCKQVMADLTKRQLGGISAWLVTRNSN